MREYTVNKPVIHRYSSFDNINKADCERRRLDLSSEISFRWNCQVTFTVTPFWGGGNAQNKFFSIFKKEKGGADMSDHLFNPVERERNATAGRISFFIIWRREEGPPPLEVDRGGSLIYYSGMADFRSWERKKLIIIRSSPPSTCPRRKFSLAFQSYPPQHVTSWKVSSTRIINLVSTNVIQIENERSP